MCLLLLLSQCFVSEIRLNILKRIFYDPFVHRTETYYIFSRDHVMPVTFACAVAAIAVRMKENACQIVVKKNKWEIVGEQLLPLCKIVLSVLKPFKHNVESFTFSHGVTHRMFPLDSHKEVLIVNYEEPEKCKKLEGTKLVTHFRTIVYDTTRQIEKWEVSTICSVVKLCCCLFVFLFVEREMYVDEFRKCLCSYIRIVASLS